MIRSGSVIGGERLMCRQSPMWELMRRAERDRESQWSDLRSKASSLRRVLDTAEMDQFDREVLGRLVDDLDKQLLELRK